MKLSPFVWNFLCLHQSISVDERVIWHHWLLGCYGHERKINHGGVIITPIILLSTCRTTSKWSCISQTVSVKSRGRSPSMNYWWLISTVTQAQLSLNSYLKQHLLSFSQLYFYILHNKPVCFAPTKAIFVVRGAQEFDDHITKPQMPHWNILISGSAYAVW